MYYDSPDSHEAEERTLLYACCTAVKTGKVIKQHCSTGDRC